MAIEIYKLEIGTTQGTFARDWKFYWEVGNQSGRNQVEISGDLAQQLAVDGLWLFRFLEFWTTQQKVHCFRIRRVWPTIDPWNDFYWRFRHRGGTIGIPDTIHNVRLRIVWYTATFQVSGACTYVDAYFSPQYVDGLAVGTAIVLMDAFGSQHEAVQTTSAGDQFRPAILEKSGNYNAVIGHWSDPRPVLSRRHLWRG